MLRSWQHMPDLIRTSLVRSPIVPSRATAGANSDPCASAAGATATASLNAVRGLTKSCGSRTPASATTCLAQRSLAVMPPALAQALGPVLQQIAEMTVKSKLYARQIQQLGRTEYPETALTFV